MFNKFDLELLPASARELVSIAILKFEGCDEAVAFDVAGHYRGAGKGECHRLKPFPIHMTLAEMLLYLRRLKEWKIVEAALHVGVDEGTWGHWENGGLPIHKRHMLLLRSQGLTNA